MTDHDLARAMFEAHEHEGQLLDYARTPRRWTELAIAEQDRWIAAARRARSALAPSSDARPPTLHETMRAIAETRGEDPDAVLEPDPVERYTRRR